MSKRKVDKSSGGQGSGQKKKPKARGRGRKALLTLMLAISIAASGLAMAKWGRLPYGRRPVAPAAGPAAAAASMAFTITPSSPSKEYVYAGGRLIATEEGAGDNQGISENPWAGNPIDDGRFFVRQQYVDILGREPDQGGWDAWTNYVNGCSPGDTACTNSRRVTTARGFFESNEFRQLHPNLLNYPSGPCSSNCVYNNEYVNQCYLTFLRRSFDQGGHDAWFNYINQTGDYDTLVNGFIASTEYRSRFGPP